MLKPLVLYGLSTGINRGAALLNLPLLTGFLTLKEYGLYALSLATANFLVPVFTLNGGGAILMEGVKNPADGHRLLWIFLGIVLAAGLAAVPPAVLLDSTAHRWLTFALVLGVVESAHELFLQFVRSLERPWSYLAFVTVKAAGLLSIMIWARVQGWSLERLLAIQSAWFGALTLLPLALTAARSSAGATIRLKDVAGYSAGTVLHSVAQGLMANANRYVIKILAGDTALGLYSLAFTLAQSLMMLNSGLGLALAPEMYRNYARWSEPEVRHRAIRRYTLAAGVLVVGLLLAVDIDRRHFGWVGHYDRQLPLLLGIVAAGFYLVGVYLFFANHLFYLKKTGTLSVQTIKAAGTGIVLTAVATYLFGIIGAAVAFTANYALYLFWVAQVARDMEPMLKGTLGPDAATASAGTGFFLAIGAAGWLIWA